jgi:hypothetical protein
MFFIFSLTFTGAGEVGTSQQLSIGIKLRLSSEDFVLETNLGAYGKVFLEYNVHEAFRRWKCWFLKLVEVPGIALSNPDI